MLSLLLAAALPRPLVLAHYMPWYESKPYSGKWGWHWTMNHFDPDRNEIASRFHPLIGAYDSSDPDVLEYQTTLMKISGIDGVLIDWYGTKGLNDYSLLNRNTERMIEACSRVGLKFSIVMEDQVVPQLVKAGKSSPDEYAKSALDWMSQKWFVKPGFLRWHGKPMLLMFGPQYYKDEDLTRLFGNSTALFTLLGRRGPAVGAFGWPEPQVGEQKSWSQLEAFYSRARTWPCAVAVEYPRFEDVYKAAGVGPGYGEIPDRNGDTFRRTAALAQSSGAAFIQIATWNDWGEGTQIEPSQEFGYRDLELLQADRRKVDPTFQYKPPDLRLPEKIYRMRKSGASESQFESRKLLLGKIPTLTPSY